jgi:hypothetical protein
VGKSWLLPLSLALALSPAAEGARVPTTQTCKPAKLPVTYALPADWACQGPPPYGDVAPKAKAGGTAPGFVVQLNIFEVQTHATPPVTLYASGLATVARQEFAQASHLRVSSAPATVGASEPAVLVTVSYDGFSLEGAAKVVRLDYFVIHDGNLYEFDYTGAAQWVTKELKAIKASAKSIHFLQTA